VRAVAIRGTKGEGVACRDVAARGAVRRDADGTNSGSSRSDPPVSALFFFAFWVGGRCHRPASPGGFRPGVNLPKKVTFEARQVAFVDRMRDGCIPMDVGRV